MGSSRSGDPSPVLFLMNDVVLNVKGSMFAPASLARRFQALPFTFLGTLGCELYAEEPLLHLAHPDRAKRLAALVMAKAPEINAALFIAPGFGCEPEDVTVRWAHISFEVMAHLYSRQQEEGRLSTLVTDRQVWRRLAA
jgi:hypothetical protein